MFAAESGLYTGGRRLLPTRRYGGYRAVRRAFKSSGRQLPNAVIRDRLLKHRGAGGPGSQARLGCGWEQRLGDSCF